MQRVTELDGVRALAALNVLVYHLKPEAFAVHGIRVDLFLILSGYLITSILLRKSQAENFLTTFYVRRVLRIWPTYFLALLATVVLNLLLPKPFSINALPNYLTFTQNIQHYWTIRVPAIPWFFQHTWSLALEEQFYLLWPLMIGLVGRRLLVPLAVGMLTMSVLARAFGFHWWLLMARCDGFALGGILASLFLDRARVDSLRPRILLGLGSVALLALGAIGITLYSSKELDFQSQMSLWPSLTILSFNLFFFAIIGSILCQTGHPSLRILRVPPLRYLGRISYGMYLYHPLVYFAFFGLGRILGLDEPWWFLSLKVAASIGVASLSWHLIEQPIATWKERFRYRMAPLVEVGPAVHAQGGTLHAADA